MANPITGTTATDNDLILPLPPEEVFTFVNRETGSLFTTRVRTSRPAMLYINTGDGLGEGCHGAPIVITRHTRGGRLVAALYRDMPRALRGEGYAELYYEDEIPVIQVAREDALWALEMVHVSGDLLEDEALVVQRTEALQRIIDLATARESERMQKAAKNAERAMEREDVLERYNPMAAAMANWGVTVQLDHRYRDAVLARGRVSRSRHVILQNLLDTWSVFHAIKIEMEAMGRWWRVRLDSLDESRARPLAHRVGRLKQQLEGTLLAAPYCNMGAVERLMWELGELEKVLLGPECDFDEGVHFCFKVRQYAAFLRLHTNLVKLMDPVARARRYDRGLTQHEQRVFQLLLPSSRAEVRRLGNRTMVPSLDRRASHVYRLLRIVNTKQDRWGVGETYNQLDECLEVYLS